MVRSAILGILKDDYMITSEDDPRIEFDKHKHVADELERMMHGKGMKQKEALERLVDSDLERMNESEEGSRELEERTISRTKSHSQKQNNPTDNIQHLLVRAGCEDFSACALTLNGTFVQTVWAWCDSTFPFDSMP